MPNLSARPQLAEADTSTIDTVKELPLGSRMVDASGNEYIYMQGIGSTAVNLAVTYDEAFLTALSGASVVGPVALAMAAVVADRYGWYQIFGSGTAVANGAVADNVALYLTAGAGKVDDADVAGDVILGMFSRGTASTQDDTLAVQLNYPMVLNIAVD